MKMPKIYCGHLSYLKLKMAFSLTSCFNHLILLLVLHADLLQIKINKNHNFLRFGLSDASAGRDVASMVKEMTDFLEAMPFLTSV